jgi:hypothetical protein
MMVPEENITSSAWFDNEYLASSACELRIPLPVGNGEPVRSIVLSAETTVSMTIAKTPVVTTQDASSIPGRQNGRSPVESLYCDIVHVLGGRCE